MDQTTVDVTGTACTGCEQNVTEALDALDGISSVTANHEADEVRVEHDEGTVDGGTIKTTIEDAGYEVA